MKINKLELTLVRHGEANSEYPPELIGGRHKSSSLSEQGREQAVALGKSFKDYGMSFDKIYTSPFKRTKQTVEYVCKGMNDLNTNVIEDESLKEISFGLWEGLAKNDVYTDDILRIKKYKGDYFAPPAGESIKDVQKRSVEWLARVIADCEDHKILAITHGCVIKSLLNYYGILEESKMRNYKVGNCSVTRISIDPDNYIKFTNINDCSLAGITTA